MIKVSVIIPVYNVENYLRECLESVTRQTLKEIEIICVNDGSTDDSLKILLGYAAKDPRIIVINQPNSGYGKAMNVGIDRAAGEYIGIVEPDDLVALSMYEDLYKICRENDLDFAKADFYRFSTKPGTKDLSLTYEALCRYDSHYGVVFDPSHRPDTLNYVMNTWSGIYRREFLVENHIRHNETPGASFQDNGFYFQTFVYGKRAMLVKKPYYRNRRDNPNSSMQNPEKLYCVDDEYNYIREILAENEVLWKRFQGMYWKKCFDNYDTTLRRISPPYKREYAEHMYKMLKTAKDSGELDLSVFPDSSKAIVNRILRNWQEYYRERLAPPNQEYVKFTQLKAYKLHLRLSNFPAYAKEDGKKLLKGLKNKSVSLGGKVKRAGRRVLKKIRK
ncbi:MAG: glycosyltransferase [Blautia sp.]|nr:glycosyltransferase [Blautia sp.]